MSSKASGIAFEESVLFHEAFENPLHAVARLQVFIVRIESEFGEWYGGRRRMERHRDRDFAILRGRILLGKSEARSDQEDNNTGGAEHKDLVE
jgi:hypothetical protein